MATGPESIDDFSAEELQNLKALAQDVDKAAEELGSTRRDVIKSLGLLGTGIAAGGISAQQLIDQVSAQASTTDGDGNVGLPSDRVDVFADGLDGNSATLGSLSADESITDTRTVTVNVPSDFSTVSAAIADIQQARRSPGLRYQINIESGHEWQQEVSISRSDLRHVEITSDDATVNLTASYPDDRVIFADRQSVAPYFKILLNGGDQTGVSGLRLEHSSRGLVYNGYGFEAMGDDGIEVTTGSTLVGNELISRNNGRRGIDAGNQSRIRASSIDVTGNAERGVRISGGVADIQSINADSCETGIYASGSAIVDAGTGGTITNCGDSAVTARSGSVVNVSNGDLSGGERAIQVYDGAKVVAAGGDDLSVSGSRSVFSNGGVLVIPQATVTGADTYGMDIRNGSVVNAQGATISTTGDNAVRAVNNSRVNLGNASVTGSTGNDIQGGEGGVIINADGCSTSSSTGSDPHTDDLWISPNTTTGEGILFARSTES